MTAVVSTRSQCVLMKLTSKGEVLYPPPNFIFMETDSIHFTYDKKQDKKCWERYNTFLKKNGDVWGMTKHVKPIIDIQSMCISMSVADIFSVYDKVFNINRPKVKGFIVTTPFSMINDDEEFNEEESVLFYSIYTSNPSVVVAHELFHIYFEKYTKRDIPNYEEAKEYFTVIMNDIFGKQVSGGYPEHSEIRERIFETWKKTKSLDECIKVVS